MQPFGNIENYVLTNILKTATLFVQLCLSWFEYIQEVVYPNQYNYLLTKDANLTNLGWPNTLGIYFQDGVGMSAYA